MLDRLGLRTRILLFFALILAGSLAALCLGLFIGTRHPNGIVLAGIIAGFGILAVTTWVWFLFDENVARPIQRLSAALLAYAQTDMTGEVDSNAARYLGDLAPAAREVTRHLSRTRNALAETVAQETTRLLQEKDRLTALASDVPVGVLMMSGEHRIAFYNGAAAEVLGSELTAGLDHSIFDFIGPAPITHVYDNLRLDRSGDRAVPLVLTAIGTNRLLSGRMRLIHGDPEKAPAYVLTIEDTTHGLTQLAEKERLLNRIFHELRPRLGTISTALAARVALPASAQNAGFDRQIMRDVDDAAEVFNDLSTAYELHRGEWWPMQDISGAILVETIKSRLLRDNIPIQTEVDSQLELHVDACQLSTLIASIAQRIITEHNSKALSLLIHPEDHGAMAALGWSGPPLPYDKLANWLSAEVDGTRLTGKDILDLHGTDIWPEFGRLGRAVLKLPLREAHLTRRHATPKRRSVAYDFDLLDRAVPEDIATVPIRDLTFVVFDTETTGLLPAQGDEICQIAAVRVVNGRVVPGEQIDLLVNPGRPIPKSATAIHHITDAMVATAPPVAAGIRQLHQFARGAILVAHNAAFDLEFLRRQESRSGVTFDHPVLDTVLLSATVFGKDASHTLDSICERLGIAIPADARHTAMGDTLATGAAFNKMIAMVESRGFTTFGAIQAEIMRNKRLIRAMTNAI